MGLELARPHLGLNAPHAPAERQVFASRVLQLFLQLRDFSLLGGAAVAPNLELGGLEVDLSLGLVQRVGRHCPLFRRHPGRAASGLGLGGGRGRGHALGLGGMRSAKAPALIR